MSTAFTWGFPEQGMGDVVPQDVGVVLQDELRKSATTAFLTPQSASPDAQTATGLGIQNVKRAFTAKTTISSTTVYTPTVLGGSWTEVYPDVLSTRIDCSGRPLMVFVRGRFTHGGVYPVSNLYGKLEARVDGSATPFVQPCDGREMAFDDVITTFGVASVSPGAHTFSLWAASYTSPVPGSTVGPTLDGALGYYLTVVEI